MDYKKFILTDKPLKILEIGDYVEINIEKNKNKYYIINTDSSKSLESDNNINNINFINKSINIALSELIIQNNNFDIIYYNTKTSINDISNYLFCIKLLNDNGIIIFNNYFNITCNTVCDKLDSNEAFKSIIDSILKLYINEIDILYIGYQLILKKNNNNKNKLVINQFNYLLDEYWFNNDIILTNLFNKLEELPIIKPKYDNFKNLKIKKLKGIEIFDDFNFLKYKYHSTNYIADELKNQILSNKNIKNGNIITNSDFIDNIESIIKLFLNNDSISVLNLINEFKIDMLNDKKYKNILKVSISNEDTNQYINLYKLHQKQININYINLSHLKSNESIKKIFEQVKNNNILYDKFYLNQYPNYPNVTNTYFNILLQTLLLKYILKKDGDMQIILDSNNLFINDYLILLNYIFKNISIHIYSSQIGELSILISCNLFINVNDILFDEIYNLLEESIKKEKEIISIFNSSNIYLNIESHEYKIFELSKSIINQINKNKSIILKNTDSIINYIKKRTIDDLMSHTT